MFEPTFIISATAFLGLCVVALAGLKGWSEWIALKRTEMAHKDVETVSNAVASSNGGSSVGAARIEIADLKERIRKLEAIASGVDL